MDPLSDHEVSQDKLITLGELSRGIAHDLKNLLTGIHGNSELALRGYKNEKATKKALTNIMLAARSAQDLVEQISSYSRNETLPDKVIDLRQLLSKTEKLLADAVPPGVNVDFQLPESAVCVRANPSQMHQLASNLCLNSLHSLARDGGLLSVKLSPKADSSEVVLTVSDDGPGIPEKILPRIFDPYFTTKEIGVGTGLGLAVVHKIVTDYGGSITASSTPGQSTDFVIHLPMCAEQPEEEEPAPEPEDFVAEKKAILLVDDEPIMRGLGMDILHTLGYRVSVAENGREALALVQKNPDYFDLVLSDSKMPEMTGPELAEQLQSIKPDLPFILVTAFNDAVTEAKLKQLGVQEIVHKPFLIENLSRALSNALSKKSSGN